MLCSPKWERMRAPASTPGRSASADCTATNAASSPRGTSAMTRVFQEHGLPGLHTGKRGKRITVCLAHLVETPQQLPLTLKGRPQQREHPGAVALAVEHAATVGGRDRDTVDVAQQEPARILRGH